MFHQIRNDLVDISTKIMNPVISTENDDIAIADTDTLRRFARSQQTSVVRF